jgi:hypothetical protein
VIQTTSVGSKDPTPREQWVIERFHYILKSGMNIEKVQIDDSKRLKNALQLYSLMACFKNT